tara:strand:+ start:8837 stop:9997 length:1161 start_codon:yes stop_codon:yes gene_type:complete
MIRWEKKQHPNLPAQTHPNQHIKNILIYHITGLAFAGTEKCLQLIASSLAKEYKVFFMYGEKTSAEERKQTMHPDITFIPFSYKTSELAVPHRITEMQPHIKNVLSEHAIDLIVTASPGYSHYPWNVITNVPIILINIFGAPTLQKNVRKFISISDTVRLHAEKWTGKLSDRDITMYAPLAQLPPENSTEMGRNLRAKLNIPETDFVFGRIGRNDDSIFDPIGIRAWQRIAPEYPNVHYLIMSPPPILVDLVKRENIPRVHFVPQSASEDAVWAFHGAINSMAHFRRDGETSGVAIAESLIAGNPIITHRSHIWNAHLEYLDDSCALIAGLDNVDEYSLHMKTFFEIFKKQPSKWSNMCAAARTVGMDKFSPHTYSVRMREIVATI